MNENLNSFQRLRARRLAEATRAFNARGKSVARCDRCQLAAFACICKFAPTLNIPCEFILLMHRDEVFKPTNTGRLIADIFPSHTHAYCWSRTEPDDELISLIHDPSRQCLIVFPQDSIENRSEIRHEPTFGDGKKRTFILLDGTWKQSGRMFHLSKWLEKIPRFALPENLVRRYAVRKSHNDNYLSTAEAAILCLQNEGETGAAAVLTDYFELFNLHYLATRGCYSPEPGDIHQRLSEIR